MATLALRPARPLSAISKQFAFRSLFSTPAIPSLLAPSPFNWSFPSLQSLLELIPPFLLAVPKKKVSHSRKAMRSANKGLKDKQNLVNCPGCGSAKLAHHICPTCYSSVNRAWKAQIREAGSKSSNSSP
ncbi:hypothetical protein OF83DRAFT_1048686 [Amylostereum chailletii]|nr:hypothetical protein OF83DRAFT_1048686 [Amylostereum chailletii]